MIASLKENFDYRDKEDYRVVILHTKPRYDAKAPDNGFTKHMKYVNFMKECEYNKSTNNNSLLDKELFSSQRRKNTVITMN